MRASATVSLLLLGLLAPAPAAGAVPPAGPGALVALGDSFISGEGGRWLGNGEEPLGTRSGTDRAAFDCAAPVCRYDPSRVYGASDASGCHRSDVAPVLSARIPSLPVRLNLACSGARTRDLWPAAQGGTSHFGELAQDDALRLAAARSRVRMVVLTAGANDVGFGSLVTGCALDWARSGSDDPALCSARAQAELDAARPAMENGLERALRGARAALAADGYERSDYRLVVGSYASPFPPGRWFRYPEDGWSRLTEGGCPVWNDDADWAADEATATLARAMRAAADEVGAEFLDLRRAFDGHQLCDRRDARVGAAGPDPLSAEWFRRLSFLQGSARESLHPNAYGQQAIGACIALLFAAPRGGYGCLDTPGEFLDGMRLVAGG